MTNEFIHVQTLEEINERRPTFLAIGSFDGVHAGHQAILKQVVKAARAAKVQAAVLTFFPHPKRVVKKLKGPYYLSTLNERIEILRSLGVNLLITHPFDEKVRMTKADDFIDQLINVMDLQQLWGGDFALGHNREGDIPYLRKLGERRGFTVESDSELFMLEDRIVSSSRVRESLSKGDVADVRVCLERPYQLVGQVIPGDQRGRTIGFPTANLDVWEEQLLPMNGVYATLVTIKGITHLAATNVGTRPTVQGKTVRVETHLLDFDEDIYGQEIRLQFMEFIRPEMKFNGLPDLKGQISKDVQQVRALLATKVTE